MTEPCGSKVKALEGCFLPLALLSFASSSHSDAVIKQVSHLHFPKRADGLFAFMKFFPMTLAGESPHTTSAI